MKKNNLISYSITFIIFLFYSYVFFQKIYLSLLISSVVSLKMYKIILNYIEKNEIKRNRIVFREFLDILNTNIVSGYNLYLALTNTLQEIKVIFNKNSIIIKNLENLIINIDNGLNMAEALNEFKLKIDLEEANIFVDSTIIALETGMDISKIISISKDLISDNISLELEISLIVDNSKKEFLIMMILPLIILILLNVSNYRELSYLDYIIRIPVFILFIFSFDLGNRIIEMEL